MTHPMTYSTFMEHAQGVEGENHHITLMPERASKKIYYSLPIEVRRNMTPELVEGLVAVVDRSIEEALAANMRSDHFFMGGGL